MLACRLICWPQNSRLPTLSVVGKRHLTFHFIWLLCLLLFLLWCFSTHSRLFTFELSSAPLAEMRDPLCRLSFGDLTWNVMEKSNFLARFNLFNPIRWNSILHDWWADPSIQLGRLCSILLRWVLCRAYSILFYSVSFNSIRLARSNMQTSTGLFVWKP